MRAINLGPWHLVRGTWHEQVCRNRQESEFERAAVPEAIPSVLAALAIHPDAMVR